ncbi:MAG TPA: dephospho-CoA kinase [Candidatus Acidoferrum sp.]|nr:dephospho-CoA kinase [Candidatus Acidoferrum sp.]
MLRIGLTGGIASGKSTVAALLRERDYPVLDADVLAHELLEPGQDSYQEVVREFGEGILTSDGAVDRQKLGAIVFADAGKRERLNQIMHPRIQKIAAQWFSVLDRPGGPDFAFENAALILEAGAKRNFDRVVVCWCRPEQQIERLVARGLSVEDAERRVRSQMPMDQKRQLADDLIDCSGSIDDTEKCVEELVSRWKRLAVQSKKI